MKMDFFVIKQTCSKKVCSEMHTSSNNRRYVEIHFLQLVELEQDGGEPIDVHETSSGNITSMYVSVFVWYSRRIVSFRLILSI